MAREPRTERHDEKKGGWLKDEEKRSGRSTGEGSWTGSEPDSAPTQTPENGSSFPEKSSVLKR